MMLEQAFETKKIVPQVKIANHPPPPEADGLPELYDGFPWWSVLLTMPGREEKAADVLEKFGVRPYVPSFKRSLPRRPKSPIRIERKCMVLPGYLFVPSMFMQIRRRDEVFDLARVHIGIRNCDHGPAMMSKAQIEKIRRIEAKLNLPPEAQGVFFKRGDQVRLRDGPFIGMGGPVIDIARGEQIMVEVNLFGRATPIWVSADGVEGI